MNCQKRPNKVFNLIKMCANQAKKPPLCGWDPLPYPALSCFTLDFNLKRHSEMTEKSLILPLTPLPLPPSLSLHKSMLLIFLSLCCFLSHLKLFPFRERERWLQVVVTEMACRRLRTFAARPHSNRSSRRLMSAAASPESEAAELIPVSCLLIVYFFPARSDCCWTGGSCSLLDCFCWHLVLILSSFWNVIC